ncbi:hypothetical protein PG993_000235 [Apiospora rasikravindrae]|uniref:Uncharacterized protein n=1 Tax=Apiospora rasikravindrae TaxID=990691 RepID=A0ABR1UAP4_9PEZI
MAIDQQWLDFAYGLEDGQDEQASSPFSSFSTESSTNQFVCADGQPAFSGGQLGMMNFEVPVPQYHFDNISFTNSTFHAPTPFIATENIYGSLHSGTALPGNHVSAPTSELDSDFQNWNVSPGTELSPNDGGPSDPPVSGLAPIVTCRRVMGRISAVMSSKLMRNPFLERRGWVGIAVGAGKCTAVLASRTLNAISRLASHRDGI